MTTDALQSQTIASSQDALPSVAPPVERKSEKLNFWGYAKNTVMVILVTKLSALAGYIAGRFAPSSMLSKSLRKWQMVEIEGTKKYPLAMFAAMITGAVGGYYEAWRLWRKERSKQLGVQDIHKDIYTELDPKTLQTEVEQNQRIQDGIKTVLQKNAPRASHAEAALKDTAPDAAMTR